MLQILSFLLLILFHKAHEQNVGLLKPDFEPYCIPGDICILDCDCTASDNCFLLPLEEKTREDIATNLNIKRDITSKGKPSSSSLSMLIYDLQLEQLSKCWASKCQNMYTECYRTPQYDYTSQSVGQLTFEEAIGPLPSHWVEIIDYWFEEMASLDYRLSNYLQESGSDDKVHNVAQILSDRVLKVGCSWGLEGQTITFVCTFGPRGPQGGEEIYKVGEPCTECPNEYACNFEPPFEKLCKIMNHTLIPRSSNETDLEDEELEGKKHDHHYGKPCNFLLLIGISVLFLIIIFVIVFAIFYGFGLSRVDEYPDYDFRG